jgi:hypothetical protein
MLAVAVVAMKVLLMLEALVALAVVELVEVTGGVQVHLELQILAVVVAVELLVIQVALAL